MELNNGGITVDPSSINPVNVRLCLGDPSASYVGLNESFHPDPVKMVGDISPDLATQPGYFKFHDQYISERLLNLCTD